MQAAIRSRLRPRCRAAAPATHLLTNLVFFRIVWKPLTSNRLTVERAADLLAMWLPNSSTADALHDSCGAEKVRSTRPFNQTGQEMPHQIHVALLPEQLPTGWELPSAVATVIDTLRFTTTACQALAVGARGVTVAAEVQAAHRIAAAHTSTPLLCGERLCRPIAGFDLGNSPFEYTAERVRGKQLIFTTTNGTRAVAAAREATSILLGALVNCAAVAKAMHAVPAPSVGWIICAGTDGQIAEEDVVTAGAILSCLLQFDATLQLGNEGARLALEAWNDISQLPQATRQADLVRLFGQASGGKNLIDSGYSQDLEFAAQVDALSLVPQSIDDAKQTFAIVSNLLGSNH